METAPKKEPERASGLAAATGKITKAIFAQDEGVMSVFGFWKAYLLQNGRPLAIYADKFSTYKMNSKFARENHELLTQFQRACNELGIELIPANEFLETTFIEKFNARYAVEPASKVNFHRQLAKKEEEQLDAIFSKQTIRVVQNDFTISFNNQWHQLVKNQPATVCKKDEVIIEERLDGTIKIRLRGKHLNYEILPVRPKKNPQPWVLPATTSKQPRKPSPNHPWRRKFNYDKNT